MPNLGQVLPLAFWGTDMANPFDQFDAQQTANPFDQFDKNAAPSAPQKSMLENVGESAKAFARSAYEAIPFRKDVEAYRHQGSTTQANYLQAIKDYGREEAQRMFYAGELTPEFAAVKKQRDVESEKSTEQSPVSSVAGTVAGSLLMPLPFAKMATSKPVGEGALAALKAYGQRIAGAGAGGATIGAIGGLGEGTGTERLKAAATGATIGGVLGGLSVPVVEGAVGAGKALYGKLVDPLVQTARGGINPTLTAEEAAARSLGTGRRMTAEGPPEFDYLLSKGEPVMIGDVGGEPTKALARSAANISPEARETLTEATRDRFLTQSGRVAKEIETFFPDSVDYSKTIEGLHEAARKANKPAYERAYAQGSSGIFNDTLYDLSQAPVVQSAMRNAERRAKNQPSYGSTKEGEIIDPFTFKGGKLEAKEGMKATDANLAYWDIVKRNLDSRIETLTNKGQFSEARDIKGIRGQLIETLEDMVPSYKAARGTAAKFYNAEDAFEAGINLSRAKSSREISELFDGWKGFNEAEKELFARGYASNLLEKVRASKDNTSIINQSFMGTSPQDRAKNLMALGSERANALESRLRVEQMMDSLRPAVGGGSTTARQIAEYGLASGAGAGIGSLQDATSPGAMAGILLKAGKGRIDSKVAEEVAKVLTSRDPKLLQKLTEMASKDPKVVQSLRVLQNETPLFPSKAAILSGAAGKVAADQSDSQPKELTIRRGP